MGSKYAMPDVAERSLIFCGFHQGAKTFAESASIVSDPDMFADTRHGRIWKAMLDLWRAGFVPDSAATFAKLWADDTQLGRYIIELADPALNPSVCNNVFFANMVREGWRRRELAKVLDATKGQISRDQDPDAVLRDLMDKLGMYTGGISEDGPEIIGSVLQNTIEQIELSRSGADAPIQTGFCDLDSLVSILPGTVTVIAGRTSVGKTAFALNVAYNMAKNAVPVLFFSLEMNKRQMQDRLMQLSSGVEPKKLRNPRTDAQYVSNELTRVASVLGSLPLYLDVRNVNMTQIRGALQEWKQKGAIQVVVVDYLQLVAESKTKEVREQEVASVSRGLKRLATEFKVCMIELAQLNRLADGQKPRLSHLRESGAIEQDADHVLLLSQGKTPEDIYVDVAKNRHDAKGLVHLNFLQHRQLFQSRASEYEQGRIPPDVQRNMPYDGAWTDDDETF